MNLNQNWDAHRHNVSICLTFDRTVRSHTYSTANLSVIISAVD